MRTFTQLVRAHTIVFILAGCFASALAAQRVYLRSGSYVVCDHQKNLEGRVRLYMTQSDESYLDVTASDIVRQEMVPVDPSAPAVPQMVSPVSVTAAPVSVDLSELLTHVGAQHHLDPDLLASVVRAESGGRARAVSRTGARGLMQLMPGTAKDLGVRDSFAPEQNVAGGTTYLDALLMYYHDNVALALAAYNAGPAAVARYRGIPPYAETRRYVARVIHDYNQRKLREWRTVKTVSALSVLAARQ